MKTLRTIFAANLLLLCSCAPESSPEPEPLTGPISLSLDCFGRFSEGDMWKLNVDSDRDAELTIHTGQPSKFTVTESQMNDLRQLLTRELFFELDNEYGQRVADGSIRTITVHCGDLTRTVTLYFLANWVRREQDRLREPARALRVWMHVRQWFDDKEAVNHTPYDQMILDAVPDG